MLGELAVTTGAVVFGLVVLGCVAACLWHGGRLAIALAVAAFDWIAGSRRGW
jgi:hypothetical protein